MMMRPHTCNQFNLHGRVNKLKSGQRKNKNFKIIFIVKFRAPTCVYACDMNEYIYLYTYIDADA